VKRRLIFGFAVTLLVACATRPQTTPVSAPTTLSIEALAAAVDTDAQRSEHETNSKIRDDLVLDAIHNSEACLAREPRAVPCLYAHAIALGLQARARPTLAIGLLNDMLTELTGAEAGDPNFDRAGPSRVRALVLLRAPGWPLGPGDAEAGLAAARRAVMLQPDYPPNLLTLAEGLTKTGDANAAREAYARARAAAEALPPTPERDDWLHEADQGLQRK
jgi:hypothetical protein